MGLFDFFKRKQGEIQNSKSKDNEGLSTSPQTKASQLVAQYLHTHSLDDKLRIEQTIMAMPLEEKRVIEELIVHHMDDDRTTYSDYATSLARLLSNLKSTWAIPSVFQYYEKHYNEGIYSYRDEYWKETFINFGQDVLPTLIKYLQDEKQKNTIAAVSAAKEFEPWVMEIIDLMNIEAAARLGNLAQVKELLEKGADINGRSVLRRRPPLHRAVFHRQFEIVKFLLDQGADVNITRDGNAPLHIAVENGLIEYVKLLLERGADINQQVGKINPYHPGDQETPLHIAAQKGYLEIVKILLDKGAFINAQTTIYEAGGGYTPLALAINSGHIEVVQFLREHGAKLSREYEES
jgi:CxxC motif-containing protein